MVSTLDFESKDPSSSLGRTSFFFPSSPFLFYSFPPSFFFLYILLSFVFACFFHLSFFLLSFLFFSPFFSILFPLSSPFLFSLHASFICLFFSFFFFSLSFFSPFFLFSLHASFICLSLCFVFLFSFLSSFFFVFAYNCFHLCHFYYIHIFALIVNCLLYSCRERDFLKKIHECMEREGKVRVALLRILVVTASSFRYSFQSLLWVGHRSCAFS